MIEPTQKFLRRGVMIAWLGSMGISEHTVRKLIEAGELKAIKMSSDGKGYYLKNEILKVIEPYGKPILPVQKPNQDLKL